jgi:hypothetical protein
VDVETVGGNGHVENGNVKIRTLGKRRVRHPTGGVLRKGAACW